MAIGDIIEDENDPELERLLMLHGWAASIGNKDGTTRYFTDPKEFAAASGQTYIEGIGFMQGESNGVVDTGEFKEAFQTLVEDLRSIEE